MFYLKLKFVFTKRFIYFHLQITTITITMGQMQSVLSTLSDEDRLAVIKELSLPSSIHAICRGKYKKVDNDIILPDLNQCVQTKGVDL